jgi:hypothetical protein
VLGASDCEQIGTGWLAQPVNAVSSLAFVPAGAWVASRAGECRGWRRWEVLGVGAALVANGVGSFAYHGTQPPWAQVAHDAPIVAIVALLAANELGRRVQPSPTEADTRARRAGRVALATGAAALAAYGLGRTGSPACRPESPFQWHAAWHGLAAVSLAAAAAARIEQG